MRPVFSLAVLSSLFIAAAPQDVAAATTQVVQQRLSDGRILLTDNPVRGATTERSWTVPVEDPVAARQRAAAVSTEAEKVSERIQRMIDQDRRADIEREQARLAALAMARQSERDDEPAYYGGVVGPYGYGNGFTSGRGRGHGHDHVDHHGKFPSTDRWGVTEKFGTVGKLNRPQMHDGRR
jgi:hypothetical protein